MKSTTPMRMSVDIVTLENLFVCLWFFTARFSGLHLGLLINLWLQDFSLLFGHLLAHGFQDTAWLQYFMWFLGLLVASGFQDFRASRLQDFRTSFFLKIRLLPTVIYLTKLKNFAFRQFFTCRLGRIAI